RATAPHSTPTTTASPASGRGDGRLTPNWSCARLTSGRPLGPRRDRRRPSHGGRTGVVPCGRCAVRARRALQVAGAEDAQAGPAMPDLAVGAPSAATVPGVEQERARGGPAQQVGAPVAGEVTRCDDRVEDAPAVTDLAPGHDPAVAEPGVQPQPAGAVTRDEVGATVGGEVTRTENH